MDSGKAAGSGSTEETEQDGFGLIVTSVRSGNTVEAMSDGGAQEECVAGAASGGFERETKERGEGSDIVGFDGAVERKPRCEFGDKVRVGIGVWAAEMVIEMKDEGHDAETGGKFGESSQEGYGIRAAADGHADALARTDETMLAQMLFERLEHRNIITEWRVGGLDAGRERGELAR